MEPFKLNHVHRNGHQWPFDSINYGFNSNSIGITFNDYSGSSNNKFKKKNNYNEELVVRVQN